MPKVKRFEIRDVRPEAGFVLTEDQVREEMPAEYKAFMKQLGSLQDLRKDYPALKETGRVFGNTSRRLMRFAFVRGHPEADVTSISMRSLDSSFMTTEVDSKAKYIANKPAFAYAQMRSQFNQVLVWAATLDSQKVVKTGWDNVRDNGDFRLSDQTMLLGRLMKRPPVPETPVIVYDARGTGVVTWRRASDGSAPVVGIAWSGVMVCMNCNVMATVETSAQYKMCKRCRDSVGVPVWYCTPECQEKHYPLHREVCKHASRAAEVMNECVRVAADGDMRAMCMGCGVCPTKASVHLFKPCRRCRRCGVAVLYCGIDCQRDHYPVHVKECTRRMFEHETVSATLVDMTNRVEEGGLGVLDDAELALYDDLVGNPFHGAASREYLVTLMRDAVRAFGMDKEDKEEEDVARVERGVRGLELESPQFECAD